MMNDLVALINSVLADYDEGRTPDHATAQEAVLACLDALVQLAPGRSVEVRIPPFGAVQAVAGGAHRRGTPRAVVETDAATWLRLATGRLTWADAVNTGVLHASGERCDLSLYLPLVVSQ